MKCKNSAPVKYNMKHHLVCRDNGISCRRTLPVVLEPTRGKPLSLLEAVICSIAVHVLL